MIVVRPPLSSGGEMHLVDYSHSSSSESIGSHLGRRIVSNEDSGMGVLTHFTRIETVVLVLPNNQRAAFGQVIRVDRRPRCEITRH